MASCDTRVEQRKLDRPHLRRVPDPAAHHRPGRRTCSRPVGPAGSALQRHTGPRLRSGTSPVERTDFVEITCPRWRRARHDGVIVHESKALDSCDITTVDGIPVTTAARTILDLGAVCPPIVVEKALEAALRRELVTLSSMRALLDRIGRQGRNGAGVLRRILDERDPQHAPTESDKETELFAVLRKHGLPLPVPQFEIFHNPRFIARPDFAYVEATGSRRVRELRAAHRQAGARARQCPPKPDPRHRLATPQRDPSRPSIWRPPALRRDPSSAGTTALTVLASRGRALCWFVATPKPRER